MNVFKNGWNSNMLKNGHFAGLLLGGFVAWKSTAHCPKYCSSLQAFYFLMSPGGVWKTILRTGWISREQSLWNHLHKPYVSILPQLGLLNSLALSLLSRVFSIPSLQNMLKIFLFHLWSMHNVLRTIAVGLSHWSIIGKLLVLWFLVFHCFWLWGHWKLEHFFPLGFILWLRWVEIPIGPITLFFFQFPNNFFFHSVDTKEYKI